MMDAENKTKEQLQEELKRLYERVARMERLVSEHQQMAEALRKSEASLEAAQRIAHIGNWDWNIESNELHWSDEIYRIFSLSPGEFGATYEAFLGSVHPDDLEFVKKSVHEALHEKKPYSIYHRILRPDGEERIVHEQAEVLWDTSSEPIRMIGTVQDITDFKRTEERLDYLSHYDGLTRLPNRVLFFDRLQQELARAHWRNRHVAVLFLNLDRFRLFNDTLGHMAGDQLIRSVAEILSRCVREGDTVARLNGDEFALILEDVSQEHDVPKIAQKILQALSTPFIANDREIFITASIGISIHPTDGKDADTLVKNADAALHRAKEQGKNTYQLYSPIMNTRAFERLGMETSLRHALEREEFVLFYQPQIDLQSGKIFGMEALIRWKHPELGVAPPDNFIPILEETGLILPVGEWVLRTACTQNRIWRNAGFPEMRVAVNLSPIQFKQQDLIEVLTRILQETRLEPSGLELELTESTLMNYTEVTVATMRAWSSMGIRLTLDDFGTGYSSLIYLKRFPIDTLKIDRSFVQDVVTNPEDGAIAGAIIALAHSLKLNVIAEGVETEEQIQFLRSHHCLLMQGYYFSRPLPAPEITRLLQTGHDPTRWRNLLRNNCPTPT
jgi:diguanylate cyclase (GGDEF)-like protein/PAS domain S-box-containing protein